MILLLANVESTSDTEQDFWNLLLENHSGEILIFTLFAILMVTLLILVPQLLRWHLRRWEIQHEEHMKLLDQGMELKIADEPTRAAGRAAMLVPMVVVISAGTVTCFLVAFKSQDVFAVALAVWAVAGVVSLAAITGCVALIGRLAQLKAGTDEEVPKNPLEDS